MNKLHVRSLSILLLPLALTSVCFAQNITPEFLKAHTEFLADDLLEGRGPGSRGGDLAAKYIAAQFQALGLQPGNQGSFFQNVTMINTLVEKGLTFDLRVGKNKKAKAKLNYGGDFVAWSHAQKTQVTVDGELLFVGYGATAPEYQWDDFKKADLKGKILLILVNDPPSQDPKFFEGSAMTYYGRWLYKFEEARRRGALGALIVHKTETAGYPWRVVENSGGGEHFALELPPGAKTPLQVAGWISGPSAEKIAKLAGLKWSDLEAKAAQRDFEPIALGVHLKAQIRSSVRKIESPNIIAVRPGTDPQLKDSAVLYCSHWEHFGIGKPNEKGDKIYNGALDNATGVAATLAIAKAFTQVTPKRTVIFVIPTGEEAGLLGSEYYVKNPVFPVNKTIAAINLDEVNVWGRTSDIFALGLDRTGMGPAIQKVAKQMQLTVKGELFPERGTYFRSDHWSFARMGIPATSIEFGQDYIGRPEGWGLKKSKEFSATGYHEPADEVQPDWDYTGTVQHSEFAFLLGLELANQKEPPHWVTGKGLPPSARFEKDE